MRKITKYVVTAATAVSMIMGSAMPAFAAEADTSADVEQDAVQVQEASDPAEEVGSGTLETVYAPVKYEGTADDSGWVKKNGYWYYYDLDGIMYADGIYGIDGKYYYFRPDGTMVVGWYGDTYTWTDEDGEEYSDTTWYYADSNGVLQSGWQKINGKWYYFEPEYYYMYSDGYWDIDGKTYLFKESGALVTGWYTDGWNWYYANTNGEMQKGWQKIDGSWYYFDDEWGYAYSDGLYEIDGTWYGFDPNGAMVTGWYKLYGQWYGFASSGAALNGWMKSGNTYYYFENGFMFYGGAYDCGGTHYLFNDSGAWVNGTGWKYLEKSDSWYYLLNGVAYTGWKKISGKWYYFDKEWGYMYANRTFFIDGQYWLFDKNGVWVDKSGWNKIVFDWEEDGHSYVQTYYTYIENGCAVTGLKTINGVQYYFGYDGLMAQSEIIYVGGVYYLATDSGELIKSPVGWKKCNYPVKVDGKAPSQPQWLYFDEDGTPHDGWVKSGGAWYYIYGGMAVQNESFNDNDTIYVFNADGTLRTGHAGWYRADTFWGSTEWYYIDANGVAYTGWKKISGKWYYFDTYDGTMYKTQLLWDDGFVYGFDKSGVMATGWLKCYDSWYYFDANGHGHDGWLKSGSVWYYISNGYMYYDGIYSIDGKKCKFDANGKWLGYA